MNNGKAILIEEEIEVLKELEFDDRIIFSTMGLPEPHPVWKAICKKVDQEIIEVLTNAFRESGK